MKILFPFIEGLLLVLACCEVIEEHLDIPGSVTMANVVLLTRVDRVMQVDYPHVLYGGHIWTQYPEMKVNIDLTFPQYVKLYEHFSLLMGNSNGVFATRIRIDGA